MDSLIETKESPPKNFFVAGLFFTDEKKPNFLLVDDETKGRINTKLPGGRAQDYHHDDDLFYNNITTMLALARFSMDEAEIILDQLAKDLEDENCLKNNIPARVLIAEILGETGYYPKDFSLGYSDVIFNNETGKTDYPRYFFHIKVLIEPHTFSKDFTLEMKNAKELKKVVCIENKIGFKSIDRDVKNPRVSVSITSLKRVLFKNHHLPVEQILAKIMTESKEMFYRLENFFTAHTR